MRSGSVSKRGIAAFGVAVAALMVVGIAFLGSPALWAQESAVEEGASAAPAPTPAAATEEAVEETYPEPSIPPAQVVAQAAPEGEAAAEPAAEVIEIGDLAAKPIDQQLVRFRADLARRTHPNDRAEMIENEHIWYRNIRQLDFNALPAHQQFPADCGQDWWSEYFGN